jgi:hypothetical protein
VNGAKRRTAEERWDRNPPPVCQHEHEQWAFEHGHAVASADIRDHLMRQIVAVQWAHFVWWASFDYDDVNDLYGQFQHEWSGRWPYWYASLSGISPVEIIDEMLGVK